MTEWRIVSEAPDYEVSDEGNVRRRSCLTTRFYKKGIPITILKPWINSKGYEVVCLWVDGRKKRFMVHRLVCAAFHGESDQIVDHIDRNRRNNSASNLRWATFSENNHNTLKQKTLPRGVSKKRNKFAAYGSSGGSKTIYLGTFETPNEAANAYNKYAKQRFGDHALLNGE